MSKWLGKILARQSGINPPAGFFAATNGSGGGDGSFGNPWDIATAFAQPGSLVPGSTLYLRGGTYNGIQDCSITGTLANPINVKQYPGEVAIIDGGTAHSDHCLNVKGQYAWFWDFTVTSSSTSRVSADTSSYPSDLDRPYDAIQLDQTVGPNYGTGCKFINMFIKNCGQGAGLWQQASNVEMYGCIVYYHGWDAPDHPHGHGCYSQSLSPSTRIIKDNIFFGNYGYGIQVYGESGHCDNHTIDGNICFADGVLNSNGYGAGMNCGGGAGTPTGNSVTNNSVYCENHGQEADFSRGNQDFVFTGNLFGYPRSASSGGALYLDSQTGSTTLTGNNVFAGLITPGTYAADWPANNWYLDPTEPTGTWSMVRPNTYAAGRGHVAIFNWDHTSSISVNVSTILINGDSYNVYHAMDPQGNPVASGTFGGTTISFPMTGLTVEAPAGAATPATQAPEFAAFIVQKV